MSDAELQKKLDSDRSFVYLKRQVEQDVADQITKLGIEGIQTRKEYKRFYPQGEVTTHVVGFTNVEDQGQESMELAQQKTLQGAGQPPRHQGPPGPHRGRYRVGARAARRQGPDPVDRQQDPVHRLHPDEGRGREIHAKAGAAVVLDVHTGEVLALANWPTYNPNDRSKLTGEQLRNRVMTDTFEPGSSLKPFTVALALDARNHAAHHVRHRQRLDGHRRPRDPRHA
jgi:cell division protein FtsI (penicillin-binding protein 3)